ncbi:MAG: ornithine acetyltransferase [Candidatus Methanogaster sp.]|uniref:Ornithine acetyltransferase n=1 Tax=Candidatus Methanogaster sp. TaxID=3386292 RepID=A0AC61KYT3_9EURY|nr:MAG: ornithine acetyltransferase [ANME-2 cluster archaeon]
MKEVTGGVCAVRGVRAYGIKEGKNGLAVITGIGSSASAGVFTRNKIIAAPLVVTREHLKSQQLSAIIANSGCANAFTGEQGLSDAAGMAGIAADRLGVPVGLIGVASTGVIGVSLDMGWIKDRIDSVIAGLSDTAEGSTAAARSIMTTDTRPKEFAIELVSGVRIGGIAKGSGMIFPDMATMLAFIYTDADVPYEMLNSCLKRAVDRSFNMIVVDGDTSTSDMVLLTATAEMGIKMKTPDEPGLSEPEFQEGLDCVCIELAKMIARDGEGAEKFIEVRVTDAKTDGDAKLAAKAIVRSPLVKTAVHGEDPNWGRVIAAAGYSGADLDPDRISLAITGVTVVDRGGIVDDAVVDMSGTDIEIAVDLGLGACEAVAWGCDLTAGYVRINADYTS